jgi:hypothetical protein
MRKTKEELLEEFPWWNSESHDIVAVKYGDEPLIRWTYDRVRRENEDRDPNETIANLNAVDHYILARCGDFAEYRTIIGGVRVLTQNRVGTCDINIKYNGKTYNVMLNDLYDKTILTVTLNTMGGIFRTYDVNTDSSWVTRSWTPMSKEEALKILDVSRVEDYGDVVKRAIEKCREIVEAGDIVKYEGE